MEDLLEVLMHITQHTPAVLEGARMEEVLMFLVVFLNSPQHVRNPYLRGKMVEVGASAAPLPPIKLGGCLQRSPRRCAPPKALWRC